MLDLRVIFIGMSKSFSAMSLLQVAKHAKLAAVADVLRLAHG